CVHGRRARGWSRPSILVVPFWAIAYVLLMFSGLCHFPGGDGRSVNRWPVGWAWGRFPASGKDWCDGRQRQQGDPRGKPGQGPGGKKHAGRQQDRKSDPGDKRNLERSGVRGAQGTDGVAPGGDLQRSHGGCGGTVPEEGRQDLRGGVLADAEME